jgi:hypothetical protein
MYFLGSVKKLDLNSTPAFLGSPTTRRGFYDIVDGTTKVICPMCYQTFTTLDLENKHMQGPCEKFREKLMNSQKALENKNRVKKGMKGKKVEGDSGFLEGMGSPGCQEDMESSGSLQSMESSGFLKGMGSPGLLEDERSSGFFRGDGSWVFETERSSRSLECERSSV